MARAPSAAALSAPPAGGIMGGDPSGGMMGADAGDDTDSGGDVVCTITKNDDGSYMVYAGDEPDSGDDSDMSDDDADAMGPGGDASAPPGGGGAGMSGGGAGGMAGGGDMGGPQGIPADSIGAALKAAMDILNADKSSEGAPGNADDQLAAGFSASQSPTPATGMRQKY